GASCLNVHPQTGWPLQGTCPGNSGFGGVARTPNMQIGNKAQAGRMLDGLMGWAIFAQANGVVGEHMHHPLLHKCCHAQGVARVSGKGQEGTAKRQVTAMERDTVHDGSHAELTYAIVDMSTKLQAVCISTNSLSPFPVGKIGPGQVG